MPKASNRERDLYEVLNQPKHSPKKTKDNKSNESKYTGKTKNKKQKNKSRQQSYADNKDSNGSK